MSVRKRREKGEERGVEGGRREESRVELIVLLSDELMDG